MTPVTLVVGHHGASHGEDVVGYGSYGSFVPVGYGSGTWVLRTTVPGTLMRLEGMCETMGTVIVMVVVHGVEHDSVVIGEIG
jgi:hypothetical protein